MGQGFFSRLNKARKNRGYKGNYKQPDIAAMMECKDKIMANKNTLVKINDNSFICPICETLKASCNIEKRTGICNKCTEKMEEK